MDRARPAEPERSNPHDDRLGSRSAAGNHPDPVGLRSDAANLDAHSPRAHQHDDDAELRAAAKRAIDRGDTARAMAILALLGDRDVKPGNTGEEHRRSDREPAPVVDLGARRQSARR